MAKLASPHAVVEEYITILALQALNKTSNENNDEEIILKAVRRQISSVPVGPSPSLSVLIPRATICEDLDFVSHGPKSSHPVGKLYIGMEETESRHENVFH